MIELALSIGALLYFCRYATILDTCFWVSASLNVFLIATQLLLLIPPLVAALRSDKLSFCARLHRHRLKCLIMSELRVPVVCGMGLMLAIAGSYAIVGFVFMWENYEYLFTIGCVIGYSLNDLALYIRIKCDFSSSYAVETFKFFILILVTIFFGISSAQPELNTFLMGLVWLLFATNSKNSLPRQIMYYLLIFLNITLLVTAFLMILVSYRQINTIMKAAAWYYAGLVLCATLLFCEFREIIVLYRTYQGNPEYNFRAEDSNKILRLYSKLYAIDQRTKSLPNRQKRQPTIVQNPQDECSNQKIEETKDTCSICLQQIVHGSSAIALECRHEFHLDCLEEWVLINERCPMCRQGLFSNKVDFDESA